jgi:hypothetical protein
VRVTNDVDFGLFPEPAAELVKELITWRRVAHVHDRGHPRNHLGPISRKRVQQAELSRHEPGWLPQWMDRDPQPSEAGQE